MRARDAASCDQQPFDFPGYQAAIRNIIDTRNPAPDLAFSNRIVDINPERYGGDAVVKLPPGPDVIKRKRYSPRMRRDSRTPTCAAVSIK